MSDKSRKSSRSALWHVGQQTRVYHTFLDVVDFKELLNATTGRMKKRSVFNERTEKASASQYFQVRISKWLLETGDWSTFTVKFYSFNGFQSFHLRLKFCRSSFILILMHFKHSIAMHPTCQLELELLWCYWFWCGLSWERGKLF